MFSKNNLWEAPAFFIPSWSGNIYFWFPNETISFHYPCVHTISSFSFLNSICLIYSSAPLFSSSSQQPLSFIRSHQHNNDHHCDIYTVWDYLKVAANCQRFVVLFDYYLHFSYFLLLLCLKICDTLFYYFFQFVYKFDWCFINVWLPRVCFCVITSVFLLS